MNGHPPISLKLPASLARRCALAAAGLLCIGASPVPAAQSSSDLAALLAKTRTQVEQFAEQFSHLRYDDDVVEAKLKANDKVAYKQEIVYDSLLQISFDEGAPRIDEQRLVAKPPNRVETRPLLDTYGFSTLEMIFHPYYVSSFQFSDAGNDVQQGRTLEKIAFHHLPNTPSPILYQTLGPDRPLDVSGMAWIDATTGGIYRIDATITSGISDAGIKAIEMSVKLESITLQDQQEPQLLPVSASIDLQSPRQHWRNVHHFSDYRKYRVAVNMPGGSTE